MENIGIVISEISAYESEWRLPVYQNLIGMLSANHRVRVFPISYPPTESPYMLYDAQVFPTEGEGRGLRALRRTRHLLVEQHAEQAFDVLHAIGADATGAVTNWVGKRLGVPTVVSIVDDELVAYPDIEYGQQLSFLGRVMVKQALMGATCIITPCLYVRRLAEAYLPVTQHHNLYQVPLGVDTELFHPPDKQGRPRVFLYVGSLTEIKDLHTMLYLMAHMPTATLDIVGDGPLHDELVQLANILAIDDRVQFHGPVPYQELPPFYQRADFLLVTSRYEAFYMPALEAIACGTRVIGTPVGIIPDVGLTAPLRDIQALQQTIVKRPRRRVHIQRARFRLMAETDYSLSRMTEGILEVYNIATHSSS